MTFVFCLVFHWAIITYSVKGSATFTVTKTASTSNDNLVWGKYDDGSMEVFSVDDDFWRIHFRSNDVFGQFEEGKKYTVFYSGVRWGLPSYYKNVLKIEKGSEIQVK